MQPKDFLQFLWSQRASAILRTDDPEAAGPAMDAAVRGGFRVVEFTLTVPGVFDRIREFAGRDGLVVGAGTVLDPDQAREAVAAGARFLVSPVTDEAVIEEAARLGVAVLPGAHTPTEMLRAHRAGAPLQKLFPGPAAGPSWLQALLGPMPFLRVVPTSGVDAGNAAAWIGAGAFAVGFVAPLFVPEDLAAGAFDKIQARAETLLETVRTAARPERLWNFEVS